MTTAPFREAKVMNYMHLCSSRILFKKQGTSHHHTIKVLIRALVFSHAAVSVVYVNKTECLMSFAQGRHRSTWDAAGGRILRASAARTGGCCGTVGRASDWKSVFQTL
jgi:hypothetical protein